MSKKEIKVGKWKCLQKDVSKISWNGGIWYPMICWWPKTSGEQRKSVTVNKLHRQHMGGSTFIFQQALKSQRGVKPTVKLSAMEIFQCAVYCTFQRAFSHGPVIKPNQTKPSEIIWKKWIPPWRLIGSESNRSNPVEKYGHWDKTKVLDHPTQKRIPKTKVKELTPGVLVEDPTQSEFMKIVQHYYFTTLLTLLTLSSHPSPSGVWKSFLTIKFLRSFLRPPSPWPCTVLSRKGFFLFQVQERNRN